MVRRPSRDRGPLSEFYFEETLYMNVGLLIKHSSNPTGRERGQASPEITPDRVNTIKPLNEIYDLVVGRSNFPERAHRRFLHYHREEIRSITTEKHVRGNREIPGFYNLFLPLTLGGLGFTNFHDKDTDPVRYNLDQSALAYYLRSLREKFLIPREVPPSEVKKVDNATRFVLAVAPPLTYPQRYRHLINVVLADPRQPLDSGELHQLPDLKAPPLFEDGDIDHDAPSYEVKHPRKSVIRKALRSFRFKQRVFSSSSLGIASEDFYAFRYRVAPSVRTVVPGAYASSGLYPTPTLLEMERDDVVANIPVDYPYPLPPLSSGAV